ncbi:MAG: hypothetical protein ACLRIS_22815 [Flavonifractor plautii]
MLHGAFRALYALERAMTELYDRAAAGDGYPGRCGPAAGGARPVGFTRWTPVWRRRRRDWGWRSWGWTARWGN